MAKHVTCRQDLEQIAFDARHRPSVAESAVRMGLSAALIVPTVFISAGYANADETEGARNSDSNAAAISAEDAKPESEADAAERLASAEAEAAARQADYERAAADVQEAGVAAEGADGQLVQANSRLQGAELVAVSSLTGAKSQTSTPTSICMELPGIRP